jgi:hypothetical protein
VLVKETGNAASEGGMWRKDTGWVGRSLQEVKCELKSNEEEPVIQRFGMSIPGE